METMKLQDVKILSGKEKLPSVPPLAQQYLDLIKDFSLSNAKEINGDEKSIEAWKQA